LITGIDCAQNLSKMTTVRIPMGLHNARLIVYLNLKSFFQL
jgi:hypothetical protein